MITVFLHNKLQITKVGQESKCTQLYTDTVRSVKAIWMPAKIQWPQNKTHYRKENAVSYTHLTLPTTPYV